MLRSDGTARPTGVLRPNSKWSWRQRAQSGPRLWETVVLFHLRDAFHAGDVWLARSRRYGDIRRTPLPIPAVPEADRSLPVPASPRNWLAERQLALADGPRRLPAKARAGAIAGASVEDRILRVDRTEAAVPDGAADPVADLYRRIVVEAQAALRMAGFWGTGRTASRDGQILPSAGRGQALNLVNARYGPSRASSSPRSTPRTIRPPSTKPPTSSTGS